MSESKQAELWCVNITGPDDVIAVASRAEAVDLAARFNDVALTKFEADAHEYDPLMWAVPMPWPHSAESHAVNLGDLGEYAWVRSRPAPAAAVAPDMLEALQECLPLFDMVTALDDHGSNALGQAENLIRAAIAKAGES